MGPARRCLVIHPGAVGDVLVALPALAHLRRLGFARVLAATARPSALLRDSAYVEATVDFEHLALHRLFTGQPESGALDALRVYDAIVSWFGAGDALYRGNLARLGRPTIVARAIPPAGANQHVSRHLLDTLTPLGAPPAAIPPVRLAPGDAERAWAAAWLAERGLEPGEVALLHPGAGSPQKAWPGFPVLARRLVGAGQAVVVTTGPADGASTGRLASSGVVFAGELPLRRLAALVAAARAFVGNDSGPSHLAALLGCPTVALFGPTDPVVWAPIGPVVRVLAGDRKTGDPWDGLTADRVEAALHEVAPALRAGGTVR